MLRQLLAVVTKAQSGLSDMPVPADASCTVTPELQALSDYLNGRITAVSTATTSAELTAMVTETLTYMKDHKEDVASSVMAYADCVYRATLAAEKAYLLSARAQAIARQKQGADVTKLLADIEAATTIVAESEKQYDAATKQSQKVDAMKTLASSVAYLQQIQVALNGPIVPATMIPSSLPSLPPSSRLSSIPRSEPPRSALPPISATPSSSAPLSESPESLPPSPTPED